MIFHLQRKVALADLKAPMRKKMGMLMGLRNFEPNEEARRLLEDIYLEDINTLILLHGKNQLNYANHFDELSMVQYLVLMSINH